MAEWEGWGNESEMRGREKRGRSEHIRAEGGKTETSDERDSVSGV